MCCYKNVSKKHLLKAQGAREKRRAQPDREEKRRAKPHTLERRRERAFKKMPGEAQARIRRERKKRRRREYMLSFAGSIGATF